MTGVYMLSVAKYVDMQRKQVNETRKAYEGLKNKDSDYAREIKGLIDLHEKVLAIWEGAPKESELEAKRVDRN